MIHDLSWAASVKEPDWMSINSVRDCMKLIVGGEKRLKLSVAYHWLLNIRTYFFFQFYSDFLLRVYKKHKPEATARRPPTPIASFFFYVIPHTVSIMAGGITLSRIMTHLCPIHQTCVNSAEKQQCHISPEQHIPASSLCGPHSECFLMWNDRMLYDTDTVCHTLLYTNKVKKQNFLKKFTAAPSVSFSCVGCYWFRFHSTFVPSIGTSIKTLLNKLPA